MMVYRIRIQSNSWIRNSALNIVSPNYSVLVGPRFTIRSFGWQYNCQLNFVFILIFILWLHSRWCIYKSGRFRWVIAKLSNQIWLVCKIQVFKLQVGFENLNLLLQRICWESFHQPVFRIQNCFTRHFFDWIPP